MFRIHIIWPDQDPLQEAWIRILVAKKIVNFKKIPLFTEADLWFIGYKVILTNNTVCCFLSSMLLFKFFWGGVGPLSAAWWRGVLRSDCLPCFFLSSLETKQTGEVINRLYGMPSNPLPPTQCTVCSIIKFCFFIRSFICCVMHYTDVSCFKLIFYKSNLL